MVGVRMADKIQLRRDSAAAWTLANPVLADGEIGWERDTRQFKVGDGVTTWNLLPYGGLQGPQGIPGEASGGDLSYLHEQASASATWTITHNLGKYPSVTVVDSAGDECEGNVNHVSLTQTVITFSAAFAGRAFLN